MGLKGEGKHTRKMAELGLKLCFLHPVSSTFRMIQSHVHLPDSIGTRSVLLRKQAGQIIAVITAEEMEPQKLTSLPMDLWPLIILYLRPTSPES